jgi:hypothetical protein
MEEERTTAEQPTETPRQFKTHWEFILFLYARVRAKKKWWLLPLLLLLLILGYVFNIPGKESILPALYFIF